MCNDDLNAAIDEQTGDIEADDNSALENDSAFGDTESDASSKTSLSSGIRKFREENGRTYHAYKDGNYLLPNDETEQERLDLHHHVFNLVARNKLHEAPIDNPARVLDAGTGTGIWAIDFADAYPASHVIGSDLSPIQPGFLQTLNLKYHSPSVQPILFRLPTNTHITQIDDIEDVWKHKPFDYIHMRSLAGSIKNWPSLLAQAYNNLVPGGFFEIVDFEVWVRNQKEPDADAPNRRITSAPNISSWQAGLAEAGDKIGRRFDVGPNLKTWLREAGFEEVQEKVEKVPSAPWPKNRRMKEVGLYQQQNMLDASSSYGAAHFTRVLGWTNEEFEVLSIGVRNELKDKTNQLYSNLYVVYGRKPDERKE